MGGLFCSGILLQMIHRLLLLRNYLSSIGRRLVEANVGIDFGSTNTSVVFFNKTENTDPQGLKLNNHTVSLLSYVDPDKKLISRCNREGYLYSFQII